MTETEPFEAPQVTEADIVWVTALLKLPADAFHGKDGLDPRQDVLRCMAPIDVAACPGSGKTTLLVAKLAILAGKWRYRTRGICVLSHTNAARHEIERRLGNTSTGRSLLSYPHFIGTIHAFVGEFLAVPWLRSQGYPVNVIDSEVCKARRAWNINCKGTHYWLRQNHLEDLSDICLRDADFNLTRRSGSLRLGENTDTYRDLREAYRKTASDGYHCYDDVFVWADDLMQKAPDVIRAIRDRFPLLFIDEAQDNSQPQSAILHRIFMAGDGAVLRQRLGDSNQAIFNAHGDQEATTDPFPDHSVRRDLPNSHRFGQSIANLAGPVAVCPQRLVGQGPGKWNAAGDSDVQHTIFLFDDDCATQVLSAYGELLLSTFPERVLQEGVFTAIGHRHRPPRAEEEPKFPHDVASYCAHYDPDLTSADPRPQRFLQYVLAGQQRAAAVGEAYPAVDKLAEGILRLAAMGENGALPRSRRHSHRQVMRLLDGRPGVRRTYVEFARAYALEGNVPTEATWHSDCYGVVRDIAEALAGHPLRSPEADRFLAWANACGDGETLQVASASPGNVFRYPHGRPKVQIRLGSIHSVKGETHAATLVFETYWHAYDLQRLRPWLTGARSGWERHDRDQQRYRLRVYYVAMTRPTHLLCLAIHRSAVDQRAIEELEERGWQVRSLYEGDAPAGDSNGARPRRGAGA